MLNTDTSQLIDSLMDEWMVEIPGGSIHLRDDRNKREWTEAIEPFLLSRYPVTQELYLKATNELTGTFKGINLPVETVSWKEAVTFCNLLSVITGLHSCYVISDDGFEVRFDPKANGYRLPTEAEWEYACRAGTPGIRYGELDLIAWYRGNSGGSTHPVGTRQPNSWGLYDMLGNVWEWCTNIYDESVYGSYRVIRGGGWHDEARGCMATNRRRSHPGSFRIDDLGFRIARNRTGR